MSAPPAGSCQPLVAVHVMLTCTTARSVTQERAAAIRTPAGGGTARWQEHTMRSVFAVRADQLGRRAAGASD